MRIRRVVVEHFRGINSLDWRIDSRLAALVGPGDSTKTTVLDAIGLALTPRFSVAFNDADFYGCNADEPIRIRLAIVDLPTILMDEGHHGKNLSGVDSEGQLSHDPIDGVSECLVVSLIVDASLEPQWSVVRPSEESGNDPVLFDDDDAARLSASEREHLGFFRVGDYVDAHLRWSRGSALSSLTASRTTAANAVVEAQRQARQAVDGLTGTPLHEAAAVTQQAVRKLGGPPFQELRPGLDPASGTSTATLLLHDGQIPVTAFGLGSRRLTSLAIQEHAVSGGAIVAIDEVETGLDPHRVVHLVRYLQRSTESNHLQVFLTTHSPVVVELLAADQLNIVRARGGCTTVTSVPDDLSVADLNTTQGIVRAKPSALLAQRVIVGEGATETGILRRLLEYWDADPGREMTSVTLGVVVTNGDGDSHAPRRSRCFVTLGYPTMTVLDGDSIGTTGSIQAAKDAGVAVLQWSAGNALEDVIAASLDEAGLQAFVDAAAGEIGPDSVLSGLRLWL